MRLPRIAVCLAFSATTFVYGQRFPKPEPEKAFADMKIYDAGGRPWRKAQEDWAGAKRRVASDPAWVAWLKEERAAVDAWMQQHRDRVEWIAGWSHDGVSPKDGSRLRWTPQVPGEETDHFSSPSDPRVELTPKLTAWWVVSFRGRHVEMIRRAAQLYRLTGDEKYAAWTAGQMDFYADNYLNWAPAREGARLFWQTLTEATNLITFTEAVRQLGDYPAAERRAAWREKFFNPEVAVLNANFQNVHNIATWQRCAVAQVALLFGDEAMWRNALDGEYGLRRQMAEGVTSDYLWCEQSLGYNNYVVSAVLTLFTAAGIHGRVTELDHEMNVAENLMLSLSYLRFPNGMLPNPADSGGWPKAPNRELFGRAYRVFPTPLGLEAAAERRDWDTLLDPPPAAPRTWKMPEVTSRNLESSRMTIIRSGPWQVYVHYGQLTRSHSQAEALNYSASFKDIDVTHDSGTTGYGSPMHREYFNRGANHNVPLVNGEGEDLGPLTERREWVVEDSDPQSPLRGQLLEYAPNLVRVAQPRYRADARAERALAIEGDRLVDTATIESTAGQPQALGLTLHVQGRAKLPAAFQPDATFAQDRPEPFSYWKDVTGMAARDRVELHVDYGQTVLHVTIECPGDFRIWHGDTPDSPPRRRESLYVETSGTKAVFTTTYAPAIGSAAR
ncbi:MAG TPA: heparinase II/III family protein [Lacunisphaera sp.]